ncbi:MAG: hypothetical protein ACYSQY_01035, partial [Planctomycetota bacterium]
KRTECAYIKEKSVAQKKQPELIVLLVMFLSALLVIVSATGMFFNELAGSVFIGSSIMLSASLVCRALQWASEAQEE